MNAELSMIGEGAIPMMKAWTIMAIVGGIKVVLQFRVNTTVINSEISICYFNFWFLYGRVDDDEWS
jgi:hypothetical protein